MTIISCVPKKRPLVEAKGGGLTRYAHVFPLIISFSLVSQIMREFVIDKWYFFLGERGGGKSGARFLLLCDKCKVVFLINR